MKDHRARKSLIRYTKVNQWMDKSSFPDYSPLDPPSLSKLGVELLITEMFEISKKHKNGVSLVGFTDEELKIDCLVLPNQLTRLLRKNDMFLLTIGRMNCGHWKLIFSGNLYF